MTPAPVAPVAVQQTPVAAAPVFAAPVVSVPTPPRPIDPAPATPHSAPAPSPTPIAAAPPGATHSLTALVTATEPPAERKPALVPSPADGDKQRKEPRLAAASAPQPMAKTESNPQEQELADDEQRVMAGDGSQRPQRWGFWRGNR